MQSEIDDTRTAVAAISRIYAKGLMTPENFQAFTAQVLTNLQLIEMQQAEFRPAPEPRAFASREIAGGQEAVARLRIVTLQQLSAEARREHHARFRVIEGEKA